MPFDINAGYSAPLKIWWERLNAVNNAFRFSSNYGYGEKINLPFGRKCFYTRSGWNFIDDSIKPLNPDAAYGSIWAGGTGHDADGVGVAKWLDGAGRNVATMGLNLDPVIYLQVIKVGDLFDDTYNFSELQRVAYLGNRRYCYVMGANFYRDWAANTIKFENIHNISEITDYYILTAHKVYTAVGGSLPRTSTDFFPTIVYNFNGTCNVYKSIGDKMINTPIDGLFMVSSNELSYKNNRTVLSNAIGTNFSIASFPPNGTDYFMRVPHLDGSHTDIFNLFAGFKMANDFRGTDVNGIMSGGFRVILPPMFNVKLVNIHKYVEMQDIPSGFMTTAEQNGPYYAVSDDETHVILPAKGLKNANSIMVWQSLDDLKKCFEDLTGAPVVFDETEAINYPSDLIPSDIVPSGYDTNSTPTVISNPDNNTDDFETPDIINPSTIVCDNYIFNRVNTEQIFNWFTQPTFIDTISKLFNDPLSAIIALRWYPFDIVKHDTAHVLQQQGVKIVNVPNDNINGHKFDIGYKSLISGGVIDYTAYYGNWADWALSKYSVYIPYVGIVDISPSAIVNKRLALFYNVDFITGNAAVILKSYDSKYNPDTMNNGQVVYLGAAKIAVDVPIVYNNYNQQLIYGVLSALRATTATTNAAISGATQGAASGGLYGAIAGGVASGITSMGNSAINFVSDFPRTEYGAKGNIGGCGSMAAQNAYLLIHRRVLSIPANGFENIAGSPSSYFGLISSGSGFVKITAARLNDIAATETELNEIQSILETGIYI